MSEEKVSHPYYKVFAWLTALTQVGMIAAPALMLALLLTRSVRTTLLLRRPPLLSIPASILLAAALHPAFVWLGEGIKMVYPISPGTAEKLQPLAEALHHAHQSSLVHRDITI